MSKRLGGISAISAPFGITEMHAERHYWRCIRALQAWMSVFSISRALRGSTSFYNVDFLGWICGADIGSTKKGPFTQGNAMLCASRIL
ncbi:hypothetical protein HMPREF1155_1222 [Slackia sp. CM382]|nr:hypothetical protein HMPREF1155_1222 [Slackia sp. CM382]